MNSCPCCKKNNPILFRRKISMGLWSEERCTFCKSKLREDSLVATMANLLSFLALPFGFIGGVEVFQIFFGSEFGLSTGYFLVGGFLGMVILGIFSLWLDYIFVPFVGVSTSKKIMTTGNKND